MSVAVHDTGAWRDQLVQMLPRGRAWQAQPGSALDQLLHAIGDEFARAEARLTRLLDEADPRTALEMLGDWENTVGLPDQCFGISENVQERQVAVAQRVTASGGQSRAYFTQLAAALGYTITIEEFRPARIGDRIGARLYTDEWRPYWRVHVLLGVGALPNAAVARIGDRIGVRLRGWGSLDLECIIRRHAPAHSIVLFSYEE